MLTLSYFKYFTTLTSTYKFHFCCAESLFHYVDVDFSRFSESEVLLDALAAFTLIFPPSGVPNVC